MDIRIGFGNDIHRLEESRELIIGGVIIPFEKGCLGHSDGDALLHAITDAILGALSLRDIGFMFPDTSSEYKDIDSSILLKKVMDICHEKGYHINNLDSTVILQRPKLSPHIPAIRQRIAEITATDIDRISVKAKTNEGLGYIGNSEAVATYCVVTLMKL